MKNQTMRREILTEAVSGITFGVTSNFQQKSDAEVQKIQDLKASNPFDKFDLDGDGKIAGTEISALKVVLAGVNFDTDAEGAIDESAFDAAFSDLEYEAK